ncbi:hypothetical protein [Salipiger mucosus]|uniref:Mobile element protein n=1 Tax=Salipiger mucosus DSM 16094 TaxID=1123237 RepID=S9QEC9_9RHOB|nr:hypothetical protein [Salipiger mucosus]EPX77938.1 Mobile element protein [Salipiger mucosus DSM 16094]
MTDDRMTLIELVEKQADGDLVREMLAFAANARTGFFTAAAQQLESCTG